MITTRARPGLRNSLVVLAVVATSVHLVTPDGSIGDATYLVVTIGAALVAMTGALTRSPGERSPWLAIAAGLCLSAVADVIWFAIKWRNGAPPSLSAADLAWLASYACMGAGLILLERRARLGRLDIDGLIDSAAVATVALLFAWEVSISTTVSDGSMSVMTRAVLAVYPVADAALLALAARLIFSRGARAAIGVVFGLGMGLWLLADAGWLLAAAARWGRWLDAGWMVGVALMSAAVFRRAEHTKPDESRTSEADVEWPRLAFTIALLGAPIAVDLGGYLNGEDANPVHLGVATGVLAALVFLRTLRILRAKDALNEALVRSERRRLRTLAAYGAEAVVVVDAQGVVGEDGPGANSLGDRSAGLEVGRTLTEIFSDDQQAIASLFARSLRSPGDVFERELRVRRPDGCVGWVAVRLVNHLPDPDVGGVVVAVHDVTDRKQAELRLEHQALHDSLTGLPNRALLHDRLEHALRTTQSSSGSVSVVVLDLDGFKTVNDSLGHEVGDALLVAVGARVAALADRDDTVARLGGDEFALLIERGGTADAALAVANQVLEVLATSVAVGDRQLVVSASIGIAIDHPGATASSLLRDADTAMYQAKAEGRGRLALFDPSMLSAATERFRLEADLAHALERDQLRLEYQPVLAMETGQVVGFEALLRWDHPELGVVAPGKFIPIAEETDLILPIGRWVLETACAAAASWRHAGSLREAPTIAVNVSGRQLLSGEFLDGVSDVLQSTRLQPDRLVVEITETALVQDPVGVGEQMASLRLAGVRVAIDDFGTGYSSLSYLAQLPVDILKIDRSFTMMITAEHGIPPLVRGLLDLGHGLDLEIVAEGIEDEVQRDLLRAAGCEIGQGFLFWGPLSLAQVENLWPGPATVRVPQDRSPSSRARVI